MYTFLLTRSAGNLRMFYTHLTINISNIARQKGDVLKILEKVKVAGQGAHVSQK